MRKSLICAIIFLFFAPISNGTVQIKEEIVIGENVLKFNSYPLQQLISTFEFRKKFNISSVCSAASRGYKGYWSISEDTLYLEKILKNPCSFDGKKELFNLDMLFPEHKGEYSRYKADWFSGEIVIPIGSNEWIEDQKNSKGYQLIIQKVIAYTIENGKVIDRVIEKRER